MGDEELSTKSTEMKTSPKANSLYEFLPSEEELFKRIMLTNEFVWNNRLKKQEIDKWLSNFIGDVFEVQYERQLALWLLSNFVFYNENEVRHLCRTLFRDFIHQMLSENYSHDFNIENSLESILHTSRFFHLGTTGESGAFILYYFRQENNLSLENFISSPTKRPESVNTIVFIDDVTISGMQAYEYLGQKMDSDEDYTKILLTLISTDEAVQLLGKNGIRVISCITLDERSKCFSINSNLFHDCKDKLQDCKKLAMTYGSKSLLYHPVHLHPLGHNGGEYAFGFFYNTPDNTLPIFWADNKGWSPIMKRYEKLNRRTYDQFGRFV